MLRDQNQRLTNLDQEITKKKQRRQAQRTDLSGDIIDELEKQVDKWITGEAYIYDLAIESLRKKTALIVKTQGAGRLQLKKLEDKHNLKTPKTTDTTVYIWNNLKIKKTETVEDFRERWDERLKERSGLQTAMSNCRKTWAQAHSMKLSTDRSLEVSFMQQLPGRMWLSLYRNCLATWHVLKRRTGKPQSKFYVSWKQQKTNRWFINQKKNRDKNC